MNLQTLKNKIRRKEIDTIIVAFPDVFGRLVGKRFTGVCFLDQIADHGTHGCNYLLTLDMEMEPMDGFRLANWEKGFGDFELKPDYSTLRSLPWLEGTAIVICDLNHHGGAPVEEAPRTVLQRQVQRFARKKIQCSIASELEFFLFQDSFEDSFSKQYRDLNPSSDYRIDYHIMQTARDEDLLRTVRNQMIEAGIPVESSKGEWGVGQHEINVKYDRPVPTADRHVLFKQGLKEIVAQRNQSVTFMAKYREDEAGNSCHIHVSLQKNKRNVFWDYKKSLPSKAFRQFLGGLFKYCPELAICFAPTINSYKRYQAASWAPTKMAWANDNRTVGFRVVGHGDSFRIENRMPGADVNPYLAFAATLAAGMQGIQEKLDCGEPYMGNAYLDEKLPGLPKSLREATELFRASEFAVKAFGEDVVEFYGHTAQLEVSANERAVTDWERIRYFERI
ncbi:MAG TPA: glutamine synthetase [Verrucomicrobiales bacterium]|nr:glutamine synthetase [Verrucomicrobiales bacterium]HIL71911.1 glutamine synthetase [Verrucomicrobiota bacterium]